MLKRPERYATILRVRKRDEDARAAALAKASAAVRTAQHRRVGLVERHEDVLQRAAEAAGGTDVQAMERFAAYERHVTQLIAHMDRDIEQLEKERGTRQSDFEASHRRRKMIDRLMERVATRWEAHVQREERKVVEESVAMRYSFKREEDRR